MNIDWWEVTTAANVVIAIIYGAISYTMIREAVLGHQWVQNPLLSATVAIFVTCTIGHGLHAGHSLLVSWASGEHAGGIGHATRATFADGRLLIWDTLTALVALWYWGLRTRFAILFHGAALCEDMAKRQLGTVGASQRATETGADHPGRPPRAPGLTRWVHE